MTKEHIDKARIAVVIPSYKVNNHILQVLRAIPTMVSHIYVVDDACPTGSGHYVEKHTNDTRITVIYLPENLGVGGAVMSGYRAALDEGSDIIVKLDGDGQMDPQLIPELIMPIVLGKADYTKGNRFHDLEGIKRMPAMRIFGNAILSLLNKLSSGYWNIFDPTNGFTAIHSSVCRRLQFNKISARYFFESDMLFRLNLLRAVVVDIPMEPRYGDEISNFKIFNVVGEFIYKHVRNFFKRIFYNYYLRDLSLASIQLLAGSALTLFGLIYGTQHWLISAQLGIPTPAGTVMLAAMPSLVGVQFILSFLGYDIASVPSVPIQRATAIRSPYA